MRRVHEGSVLDLIIDIFIFVKRECPAEAAAKTKQTRLRLKEVTPQTFHGVHLLLPDVDDDTHRPHVQRAVVSFVPEDLWSKIGWRTDHRAAERLLTNNSSESEVAQLHL